MSVRDDVANPGAATRCLDALLTYEAADERMRFLDLEGAPAAELAAASDALCAAWCAYCVASTEWQRLAVNFRTATVAASDRRVPE